MNKFVLHQKLASDCIELGTMQNSLLLLMNNSLVPWFILVPKTMKRELYELTDTEQTEIYAHINLLSEFITRHFNVNKINMASIGNVVNQIHIHVIGRHYDDYCWPDVVWGKTERQEYKEEEIKKIVQQLHIGLKGFMAGKMSENLN